MSVQPIAQPFPGERLSGVLPEMTPNPGAGWLRRLNHFTGRALTPAAMAAEQDSRGARLALRGQSVSPGIVQGLHVALEHVRTPGTASPFSGWRLHVEPGHGLTAQGEDVYLPRPLELDLRTLRIVGPHAAFWPRPTGSTVSGDAGTPRFEPILGDQAAAAAPLPRAGILLLQPVETEELGRFNPDDACELDPEQLAFEDERRVDGCRVVYFPWPDYSAWPAGIAQLPPAGTRIPLPPEVSLSEQSQWRNALAYTVFDAERRQRVGTRLSPLQRTSSSGESSWVIPYEAFPWSDFGVALALVAWDAEGNPLFADRAAVARAGGRSRLSTPLVHGSTNVFLAQARMEQFIGHIAELLESSRPSPEPQELAAAFRFIPPAGLLPLQAVELLDQAAAERRFDGDRTGRSLFFPSTYNVETVPVPEEQLDLALDASASLAPYDLSIGEEVRVLVPVPQAVFEPELLTVEKPNPEFARTLRRFELTRETALLSRESLRSRARALAQVLDGRSLDFPAVAADPGRLGDEPLPTREGLPFEAGRRSPVRPFSAQSILLNGRFPMPTGGSNVLKIWVELDPANPPTLLAFEFANPDETATFPEDGPIAVWGTPSRAFANRTRLLEMGPLPEAGRWTALDLRFSSLTDLPSTVQRARLQLFNGRVAVGNWIASVPGPDGNTTWLDVAKPSATPNGEWTVVENADLLTPFENAYETRIRTETPFSPPTAHLSAARFGSHSHDFRDARRPLTPGAGDILYTYVYLDPENPPEEIMIQWRVGDTWAGGAYWGTNKLTQGTDQSPSRFPKGPLPNTARWIRLDVKASEVGLGAKSIDGMAFRLFGGAAAWGPTGRIPEAENRELVWFDGESVRESASLNADSRDADAYEPWTFVHGVDAAAPFTQNPSPIERGERIAVPVLDLETTLLGRSPWLFNAVCQLPRIGFDAFIQLLKRAADQADDSVDFGFVQAQTNIYRLRQMVLGNEVASKLAVSPVLSALVKGETAVATKSDIKSFLAQLKATTPAPTPATRAVGAAASAKGSTFAVERVQQNAFSQPQATTLSAPGKITLASSGGLTSLTNLRTGFDFNSGAMSAQTLDFGAASVSVQPSIASASFLRPPTALSNDLFRTNLDEIRFASPTSTQKIDVRTATVAQRLEPPSAQESKSFAGAARAELLQILVGLELFLDDLFVPSLFHDNKAPETEGATAGEEVPLRTRRVTFGELKSSSRNFIQEVRDGEQDFIEDTSSSTNVDEARQFSAGARATEATVATLRLVEGRIQEYRLAIADSERVRDLLLTQQGLVSERLNAIDKDLAEARHDVSITHALLEDELARVRNVNTRRDVVIRQHVRFLAYIRPRTSVAVDTATPSRPLNPALIDPPIPAILRLHDQTAPELASYLELFRHAPIRWFPEIPPYLNHLDRPEALQDLLKIAQARTSRLLQYGLNSPARTDTRFHAALQSAFTQNAKYLVERRKKSFEVDFGAILSYGWKDLRNETLRIVTVGDLLESPHGPGDIPGMAARFLDVLGRIATGLHAEFAAVPPVIRLLWAESYSEFDHPPQLRDLSRLPRFGEIEWSDRRQMQACADWLFARVDATQADAVNLVTDLVRVCLLLASHAPVNQIISGHVPKPAPALRGNLVQLTAFDPSKIRAGMTVLLHQSTTLVAKAVVEDFSAQIVSARVIESSSPSAQIDSSTRVQFIPASSSAASTPVGTTTQPSKGKPTQVKAALR